MIKKIRNWFKDKLKSQSHREFIYHITKILSRINPKDIDLYLNKDFFTQSFIDDVDRKITKCDCKEILMNQELFTTEIWLFIDMNKHRKDIKESLTKCLDPDFKDQFEL